ncbi:gluconolactonase [Ciceribacter naphthalenivorans]|uniref:Gluconolactonase n=1 Tax=Sphingomonas psychrolutea TaxID=1259676 RepID=A0ABQ6EIT5_9SPHN|nr:gluconolactonase [Ciceribacter naphthalenivorans]GLT07434.1 gluconolactonase [Sphingomonas psychrolutea]
MELGEGPVYDPDLDCLWWFDILGCGLRRFDLASGTVAAQALPFMGSVIARIDGRRHLLASDQGLFLRDLASGELTPHCELEPSSRGNRSNDGRVHPSGALWIGTMGKDAATGAGAIYHVAGKVVTRIFDKVSIPNSICFSPNGEIGYFVDSRVNILMRVPVSPTTGLPTGQAEPFIDGRDRPGVFDGSVCDANGDIWNARWGGGGVDRYDPAGRHLARYDMPAERVTCPAFFGPRADRLMITSCWEGLDAAGRTADPLAGATFELGVAVEGRIEPAFQL